VYGIVGKSQGAYQCVWYCWQITRCISVCMVLLWS